MKKKRLQVNKGLLFIGLFMAVISCGQGFDDTQTNKLSDLNKSECTNLSETGHKIQTTHILKGDMSGNNFKNTDFFQVKPNQGKCEIVKKSDNKIVKEENEIAKQEKYKEQNFLTTQYYEETVFNIETGHRDEAINETTVNNHKKSTQGQWSNLKEIKKQDNISRISQSELIFRFLDNLLMSNKSTNLTNEQIIGLEYVQPVENEHKTFYTNDSESFAILQAFNLSDGTFILSNDASKTNSSSNHKPENSKLDNKLYLHGSKYQFHQTSNTKSFKDNMKQIYYVKLLIHNRTNLKLVNRTLGKVMHLPAKIVYDDNVPISSKGFNSCNPHPDKLKNLMNIVIVALVVTLCIMGMTFLILFCIKTHEELSARFVRILHLPLPEFPQKDTPDQVRAPEPTKSQTAPEPTKSQTAPEPTKCHIAPEPTKSQTTPEPTKSQTAPKPTKSQTAPEPTKSQTAPKPTKSQTAAKHPP